MIKSIIRIGLVLMVGLLAYNLYLGTPEEQENSKRIINEIKDVGRSVGKLIKDEKAKFDDGKYDNALERIGNVFKDLRGKVQDNGDLMDRIKKLEDKKDELKDKIKESAEQGQESTQEESKAMLEELERLTKETENLVEEVQEQEQQE
ncbi:MAG: hypothetical protein AAFV95_15440 [Bacteroidota bacterium]